MCWQPRHLMRRRVPGNYGSHLHLLARHSSLRLALGREQAERQGLHSWYRRRSERRTLGSQSGCCSRCWRRSGAPKSPLISFGLWSGRQSGDCAQRVPAIKRSSFRCTAYRSNILEFYIRVRAKIIAVKHCQLRIWAPLFKISWFKDYIRKEFENYFTILSLLFA